MKSLLPHRALTLLRLSLAIATISITACGTSSASGIKWKEPAVEALVRQKLEKPKGAITQSDLDDIWGIELFGDSHIFFNADGGYEMFDSADGYANEEEFNMAYRLSNPGRINLHQEDSGVVLVKDGTYSVGDEQYARGSISSLSDFANFRNLKYLHIYKNDLDDLSGLSSLENLIELILIENDIQDVSGLSELNQIDSLVLTANKIEDASPIVNLAKLRHLRLIDNQISDLKQFTSLSNLDRLIISSNPISTLEGADQFERLTTLTVNNTRIDDLSILAGNTSLIALGVANLETESIDLAPLADVPNLKSLGVFQDKAKIINLRSIGELKNLRFLTLQEGNPRVEISDEDINWLREQLPGCFIAS